MVKKTTLNFFLTVILLLFTPKIILADPAPNLAPLKPLSGKWVGKGEGINGQSVVKQVYHFVLDGTHFQSTVTARFKPEDGESIGRIQKAAGIFSFDSTKKIIVYHEFTSDGQVHLYKLIQITKDGLTLIFQTDKGKDKNADQQTRLTFHITNRNKLQKTVSLTSDGKTFKQVESIVLHRVKIKKKNRV